MILPVKRNKNNNFTVVRCHYSADPEKNTPEWISEAKSGMPERGWNREYEIDYSSFAGKAFYPEFKEYNIAKENVKYQLRETLYRGWDFGFHRPCCLITKLNEFTQWCWLKCILGEDEGIMEFGKRVRKYCLTEYPGAKYIDACDIAGTQVSDKSEKTSVQILNALGIWPQSRKQPIKQGAEIIRQKLAMRADGKVGLLVNPDQEDVIDGFKGGIHYPEPKEGQPEKEFYEKDGYYDHIFDGSRYLSTEMFTVIGQQQSSNEIATDPLKHQWRDGRPSDEEQNEITTNNPLYGVDPNLLGGV